MEPVLRDERACLVRPCRLLRDRCIYGHPVAGLLGPDAVAWHAARHGAGRHRGFFDWPADLSPARPLLCAVDAGLSPGGALRAAVLGLPGSSAADAPRA